jgi:hypothetical protein
MRVAWAYTEDCVWRNRGTFIHGRDEIVQFLTGLIPRCSAQAIHATATMTGGVCAKLGVRRRSVTGDGSPSPTGTWTTRTTSRSLAVLISRLDTSTNVASDALAERPGSGYPLAVTEAPTFSALSLKDDRRNIAPMEASVVARRAA